MKNVHVHLYWFEKCIRSFFSFFLFFRFRIRMGTTQKVVLIDTWKLIIFASVNARVCSFATIVAYFFRLENVKGTSPLKV